MKNLKKIFVLLAFILMVGAVSAQKQNIEEKAETSVTTLDKSLTEIDASLALTDEQKESAMKIFTEGLNEMKEARKNAEDKEAGKEAMKPIRKEMNKTIRTEVLTQEQRRALTKAKKNKK